MVAVDVVASPLKWHGGKGAFNGALAKWLIGLMPPHLHYVEPYAGGLSVLLAKNPNGVSEVVNDLHRGLTNFWRVIGDEAVFQSFQRMVEAIPFSQIEWQEAKAPPIGDRVAQAVTFFVHCRQSLAGRRDVFSPLSRTRTRSGMNEQVSAWWNAVEGLPAVRDRLKRVVILNEPALKVIQSQDSPTTLFYLDPPYLHETRKTVGEYGPHEMRFDDHETLLKTLRTIRGKFVLSGYRSGLYDKFAKDSGWHRSEYAISNCAASGAKKRKMIECAWTNFDPKEGAKNDAIRAINGTPNGIVVQSV